MITLLKSRKIYLFLMLLLPLFSTNKAFSQHGPPPEVVYSVDWNERLAPNTGLKAHDFSLLGDAIDLHTGSLSFEHVDISIPGNSELAVELRRTRSSGPAYNNEFGDWQLKVPTISTKIMSHEWNKNKRWAKNRCSSSSLEATLPDSEYGRVYVKNYSVPPQKPREYSDGILLSVPGRVNTQILEKSVSAAWPSSAKKVTAEGWYLTCISNIDGAGTEGFYAIAPNGDRYRFDVIRKRERVGFRDLWSYKAGKVFGQTYEYVYYDALAASEVTDVNGNWVRYSYDSQGRLTRIYSNDDRRIDITYHWSDKNIIGEVIAHPGTSDEQRWQYDYANEYRTNSYLNPSQANGTPSYGSPTFPNYVLKTVTLPDDRYWTFNLVGLFAAAVPGKGYRSASDGSNVLCKQGDQSVSVKHPDGVTGTFELSEQTRFINSGTSSRFGPSCPKSSYPNEDNLMTDIMAVTKKTLSGPGIEPSTWQYSYINGNTTAGEGYNRTTIIQPDGTKKYQAYGFPKDSHRQLVKEETFANSSSSTPISTTEYAYILAETLGNGFVRTDPVTVEQPAHIQLQKITQDGENYNTRYTYVTNRSASNFGHGYPSKIEKWSSLGGGTRITDYTYSNDSDDWVIGQVNTITKNGKQFDDYDYDSKGHLIRHKRFYQTIATLGYHTSGTQAGQISWIRDALNRNTSFSSWYRGAPQTITYADNTSFGRTLNRKGQVTSATNQRGVRHYYHYDSAGRIGRVDKPSPWNDVTIDYHYSSGQLMQTLTHGSQRSVTRYDALLRPTQVLQQALSGGGDNIYIESEYDNMGRKSFTSLPSSSANSSIGVSTKYDAYGRVTETKETASGGGTIRYQYLSGNRVQVTDPLGNRITTTKSGFGDPSDGKVILEQKPEGISTSYSYDIYGNLLALSQAKGNGTNHVSRYVYDSRFRKCRKRVPEGGDTLYSYNNANEMTGYAEGLASGSSCATPPSSSRVNLSYDLLGRLTTTNFPGSTPDITRTYDGNGNITSVRRGNFHWTYDYNNIDLIDEETLSVSGANTYDIRYTYNNNEQLIRKRFPSGREYSYSNDGHGRVTGIYNGSNSYISGVEYHPNGKIDFLARGNGSYYEQHLNARQLPSYIGGDIGATMHYTYNAKGQVTNINSGHNQYDRSFTYDGAGRLRTATGSWGSGSYSYDALGNITRKVLGSRAVDMTYNSLNRLASVKDSANGNNWRSYSYDARGNITQNGRNSFVYDYANQPTSITGTGGGTFAYDGNLKRVRQIVGGETIYSIYDIAGSIISRHNVTSNEITDYITLSGQTVARIKNGIASYPLNDHLGTAYMVSDQNGGISSANTFNYTPFGEVVGSGPGAFGEQGFTGHIEDKTGLVYMQARYYDPAVGRFLSADPIGYEDQLNLYAYVYNNPIIHIDPLGLSGCQKMEKVSGTTCYYPGNSNEPKLLPIKNEGETPSTQKEFTLNQTNDISQTKLGPKHRLTTDMDGGQGGNVDVDIQSKGTSKVEVQLLENEKVVHSTGQVRIKNDSTISIKGEHDGRGNHIVKPGEFSVRIINHNRRRSIIVSGKRTVTKEIKTDIALQ